MSREQAMAYFRCPIGFVRVVTGPRGVVSVDFKDRVPAKKSAVYSPELKICIRQLKEYFKGSGTRFSFRMDPAGTVFQKKVWAKISRIPYGRTISYQGIAAALGKKKAARAVGQAVGKNPVCVLVPCHRVLGSRGLGGYSAGMHRKKWLLKHEKARRKRT